MRKVTWKPGDRLLAPKSGLSRRIYVTISMSLFPPSREESPIAASDISRTTAFLVSVPRISPIRNFLVCPHHPREPRKFAYNSILAGRWKNALDAPGIFYFGSWRFDAIFPTAPMGMKDSKRKRVSSMYRMYSFARWCRGFRVVIREC